jgi:hypothetical protein
MARVRAIRVPTLAIIDELPRRKVGPLITADSGIPDRIHETDLLCQGPDRDASGGPYSRDIEKVDPRTLGFYDPMRAQRERDDE